MAGDCGSTCPVEGGFYAYKPNVGGNAVLLAAFAVLVLVALYLGVRLRTPVFSATLATGMLLEVIGFVGRVLLGNTSDSQTFFVLSMLGTLLGPVCVSGAILLTLPHILTVYGDHLSPLRPMVAGVIFYSLAAIAAVIQVIGVVFVSYDMSGLGRMGGTSLIAGGLGVQLLALLAFSGLHLWFMIGLSGKRSGLDPKHSAIYQSIKFKRFLFATEVAAVLLIAYTIYRIAEMASGPTGALFQNQAAFMVINGAVPFLSALLITVLHPGAAFGSAWGSTSPLRRTPKRRSAPAPLRPQERPEGYKTHALYNPEIRAQISPTSQRHSNVPTQPKDSPGLPSHPKAAMKGSPMPSPTGTTGRNKPSPMPSPTGTYGKPRTSPMPSPTGTAQTAGSGIEHRSSLRRSAAPPSKRMVEKDELW